MTWKELYEDFVRKLQALYSEGEAEAITTNLFTWVSGGAQLQRFHANAQVVKNANAILLEKSLDLLLKHTPLQYVTGEAWFYNLKFRVSEAVLIPRPETEELVRDVLVHLKNRPGLNVLDIGTGSGCIAISLKKNSQESSVMAIDISEAALAMALKNAQDNKTDIDFRQLDFLKDTIAESFDVIVSNPPYIPESELTSMDQNVVSFEPHVALFVPSNDPLLFYRKIALLAMAGLESNGKVFLETHQSFAKDVAALFKEVGFEAEVKEDMFGKERFVWATRYP